MNGETYYKVKKILNKGMLYFSIKCLSGGIPIQYKPLKCKYTFENNVVHKKSGSSYMDIVIPRVSIGIKYPIFDFDKDEMLKMECISKIILENKFGFSSANYQYMLDNDLVSGLSYTFLTDKCSSFLKFTKN